MPADPDIVALVWGETSQLASKDDADPDALTRLHAVVGRLAAQAKKQGLGGQLQRALAPRADETAAVQAFQQMRTTADKVAETGADESWVPGGSLPTRAALWEITATGAPRMEKPLPGTVSWINGPNVVNKGKFEFVVRGSSDGRIFGLFESNDAPGKNELPFISVVTGSGVPAPESKNPFTKLAWWIGIVGVILLIAGGSMSAWSGRSMSGARNSLATTDPSFSYRLLEKITTVCAEDYLAFPAGKQAYVCDKLLSDHKLPQRDNNSQKFIWEDPGKANSVLEDTKACLSDPTKDGCNSIWRAAVEVDQELSWKKGLFGVLNKVSAYLTGTNPAAGSTSILAPFLIATAGLVGLVVALGLGTKGRATGVWIDTRNRVSLARAQVTLWTIVVLAGYGILAMFNIGFAGIVGTSAGLAVYQAFPAIPASIAAVLGIATASTMISALILPTKNTAGESFEIIGGGSDLRKRGVPFFGAESKGLDKRPSPALASVADVFMGEEIADADTVDLARLQNVVITITLVLGFFSLLIGMTSSITGAALLSAKQAPFTSLPELGATFTSLLLASHATYLVAKAYDPQGTRSGTQ